MSIPAFVIDANQRPLLPTTPAYARVLLRDGKAQRIPHPALAIIQLSHTIDAPQMPPVLVGIMVHEKTASLFVFTAQAGSEPLLSLMVDFIGDERHLQTTYYLTSPLLWWVDLIGATVDILTGVLPISHIAVFKPEMVSERVIDDIFWTSFFTWNHFDYTGYQAVLLTAEADPPDKFPADLCAAFLAQVTSAPPANPASLVAVYCPEDAAVYSVLFNEQTDQKIGISTVRKGNGPIFRLPVSARQPGVLWYERPLHEVQVQQRWPTADVAVLPTRHGIEDGYGQGA